MKTSSEFDNFCWSDTVRACARARAHIQFIMKTGSEFNNFCPNGASFKVVKLKLSVLRRVILERGNSLLIVYARKLTINNRSLYMVGGMEGGGSSHHTSL